MKTQTLFCIISSLHFFVFYKCAFSKEINLKNIIDSVDKNMPTVLAFQQELNQAQADLTRAQGGFDSTLKSKISAKPNFLNAFSPPDKLSVETETAIPLEWNGLDIKGRYRFGQADPNWGEYGSFSPAIPGQIELGIGLPLARDRQIDKRRTQKKQAEVKLRQTEKQITSQTFQIYELAILAWTEAITANLRYKIQTDLLDLAKIRDQALLLRLRHGDIPEIEKFDNQRSIQKRLASLKKSHRDLLNALLELSLYWRSDQSEPILAKIDELPSNLNHKFNWNTNSDDVVKIAIENRPDFAALERQIENLRLEKNLVENSLLPKINFDMWAFNSFATQMKAGSLSAPNAGLLGSLILEIPVQNRTNEGILADLNAQLKRLELIQKWQKEKIKVENQAAIINLNLTKERIDQLAIEVTLSKKVEDGERVKFQNGDSNLLMVYIREENTADAALRLLEAQQELVKYSAYYLKMQGLSPALLADYFL